MEDHFICLSNTELTEKGRLTSKIFYKFLLPKIETYLKNKGNSRLIFDFRNINDVDAYILTNLLCFGHFYKINFFNSSPPIILVKNYSNLKSYLNKSLFVRLAEEQKLFIFEKSIDCGYDGNYEAEPILYFESVYNFGKEEQFKEETERSGIFDDWVEEYFEKINKNYYKKYKKYIVDPQKYKMADVYPVKEIASVCFELLFNSQLHSSADVYFSFRFYPFIENTNSDNKKIARLYISISDYGMGIMNSLNQKIKNKLNFEIEGYNLSEDIVKNECEAILKSVYMRSIKKRGMLNSFNKILNNNGTIRLHSNDIQVLFNEKLLLENEPNKDSYKRTLSKIRKTVTSKFDGVHYEIEIPFFEKKGVDISNENI